MVKSNIDNLPVSVESEDLVTKSVRFRVEDEFIVRSALEFKVVMNPHFLRQLQLGIGRSVEMWFALQLSD